MKKVFMNLLLVAVIATSLLPVVKPAQAVPATIKLTATPGCGFVLLKWEDTDQAYQYEPRMVLPDGTTYPLEDFPLVGKTEYKHEGLETGKEYCYVVFSYDKESNKLTESNKACATPVCEEACVWKCGCLKDIIATAANVVTFNEGCKTDGTPVYLNFSPTLVDIVHGWTIEQYLKICKEKGITACVSVCVGPNNNIVSWKADVEGNDCCKPQPTVTVTECICIKITEVDCTQNLVKGTDAQGNPWCLENVSPNLCGTLKTGQCYKVCGEILIPGPTEKWACKRMNVSTITEIPCECKCLCVKITKIDCQNAATNVPWPIFYGTDENGNSVMGAIQDQTILDLNGNVIKCEDIKPETCWQLCGFWREITGAAPAFVCLQAQQVDCSTCKPTPSDCCRFEIKPQVDLPECFKPGGQYSLYFELTNGCDKAYSADLVLNNTTPGLTATITPPNISVPPGTTGFNVLLSIPTTCEKIELSIQAYIKDVECPPVEFKISIPCCGSSDTCCKYEIKPKTQIPDCIKPGVPFVMYYDIINYCPDIQDFNFAYNIVSGGVSPLVNPMVLTVPGATTSAAGTITPGSASFSVTFNPPASCNGEIDVVLVVIPKNSNCPKREIPIKLKCCPTTEPCCKFEVKRLTQLPECMKPGEQIKVVWRLFNLCDSCEPIPYNANAGQFGVIDPALAAGEIPCEDVNYIDVTAVYTMPTDCTGVIFSLWLTVCDKRTQYDIKMPCCGETTCCKFDIKKMSDVPTCLKAGEKATVRYRLVNACDPCTPIPFTIVPGTGVTVNVPSTKTGTIPCGTNNFADISVTFTMPNPCKETTFVFYISACGKRTPVEVKIPCCGTSTVCCNYEVKQLTKFPDCVTPGKTYSIKYEIDNNCTKPMYFIASAQGNVTVTVDPVHSITVPAATTAGPGTATFTLNFTVKECKDYATISLVIAPTGVDCPKKTISIKIPCCSTVLCCDYSLKLLTPVPECVKAGQKYDLKVEVCNNCTVPLTIALSRCPGTTGLTVAPATISLGAKGTSTACTTVVVTIWADDNICKQNNGIMEYCLYTKVVKPENCGEKGIKQHKFRVLCCGYQPQNCCQYDVKPLNTPPTELAPGETFIVKYQVSNTGEIGICAPLNMTIENIQPAGALVISPMTFSIAAGGMVNLDVKIIMPACTSDKTTFSFDVKFEGCDKTVTVKFDVLCTEGCKLNLMYKIKLYEYWKNGEFVEKMPVYPEIRSDMNDRSFLVIRYVTKHLGATLAYDATEKMVTIVTAKGKKIMLWIGKTKAQVDGKEVLIDPTDTKGTVKPYISGAGYTMLPLRFVSDQLGAKQVKWHGDTQIAELIFECPETTTPIMPMRPARSFQPVCSAI